MVPSAAGPAIEWLGKWRESGQAPPAHLTLPVSSFPELVEDPGAELTHGP